MAILRKGSRGAKVKELQEGLRQKGFTVGADGTFGAQTELAVIALQRRHGLLPDGIAGPRTLQLLLLSPPNGASGNASHLGTRVGGCVTRAAVEASVHAGPASASRPVSSLRISQQGLRFIYVHEAQRGVSNHLHWPGGEKSGVTLGPGYDMGGRSAAQITQDLISVGVSAETAKKIGASAAGLVGQKAKAYAHENKKLVNLTQDQEMKLLGLVVPAYEHDVKTYVRGDLFPYQFDALVSFDYNCGPKHTRHVAHLINKGEVAAAMVEMKKVNTSGGEVMPGLVSRRDHEVTLYLYGKYATSAR